MVTWKLAVTSLILGYLNSISFSIFWVELIALSLLKARIYNNKTGRYNTGVIKLICGQDCKKWPLGRL